MTSEDCCVQCDGPLGGSWMDTKTVCSRCVLNEHRFNSQFATQQPCWSDPGEDTSDLEDPEPHCVHGCTGNESCAACGYG